MSSLYTVKEENKKSEKEYCLIPIEDYERASDKKLVSVTKKYTKIEEVIKELENDKYYNYQLVKDEPYKIFGDIDYLPKEYKVWKIINRIIKLLNKHLELCIERTDVALTKNDNYIEGMSSYHYVIRKYNGTLATQKRIFNEIILVNIPEKYKMNNGHNIIDVSNYCRHKFRMPNQTKGTTSKGHQSGIHRIKKGAMEDFVLDYLPEDSINIDDKIKPEIKQKKKHDEKIIIEKPINAQEAQMCVIKNIEWKILIQFMDECYKPERYNSYEYWINIGMAIKNRYGDSGYDLFNYFSKKSKKHDTDDELKTKYDALKIYQDGVNIGTLYYYAKQDNKEKYIELIKKVSPFKEFAMTSTDVAGYIKLLKPNNFVWKDKLLYCYNGKYWEQDDLIMRQYISTELYEFMKDILVTCFWDAKTNDFDKLKKTLDQLKKLNFKKEVIETTREYMTNETIEFDSKWYLFGFTNVVYDLIKHEFREYRYDDFISTTTGYDWKEPTEQEYEIVKYLFKSIMPIEDERELLKEIMSTGLEGRCLEKFIILNGIGRNGKGLMDDLWLKALGNYGFTGNNSILFEQNKTGSNPEKNNLHKKRYVMFREPKETLRFENSVVKELTGGGNFSARGHYESNTQKQLYLTLVVECNKRPLFAEEPKQAELNRLIDIQFRCTFTGKLDEIDESRYIFSENIEYKK